MVESKVVGLDVYDSTVLDCERFLLFEQHWEKGWSCRVAPGFL